MNKYLYSIFLVLTLATVVSVSRAQTGTITGHVSDDDGSPLPGANVVLENTTYGAATGSDGHFEIKYVPPGTYTVTVTMIGFEQKSSSVQVTVETAAEVTFTLPETIIETEAVVVSASRKPRSGSMSKRNTIIRLRALTQSWG
ncbi:MAG: carboxypeptidase-like regulatory domain-containing protein [bacterium]